MKENITDTKGEWIVSFAKDNWWRFLLFILLTANLWLSQSYVTRKEYQDDKNNLAASVNKLTDIVTDLKQQLAVSEASSADKIQTEELLDHEKRIRALEAGRLAHAEH